MDSRSSILEKIIGTSAAIAEQISDLDSFLAEVEIDNKQGFSVTSIIPDRESSYADVRNRFLIVDGIIQSLKDARNIDVTPIALLESFVSNLQNLSKSITAIKTEFAKMEKQGKIVKFDYENFHALISNNENIDVRSSFQSFYSETETIIDLHYKLLVVLRPTKANFKFQSASKSLAEIAQRMEGSYRNFVDSTLDLGSVLDESRKTLGEITNTNKSVEEYRENISKKSELIESMLTKSSKEREEIGSINESAKNLKTTIDQYESSFLKFQKSLNQRENSFNEIFANLQDLENTLNSKKVEIESVVTRSEQMLKGATVAGLAKTFGEIKDTLTGELFWARFSFYISIIVLFIFAIPIILFVFSPVVGPIVNALYPNSGIDFGSIVDRSELTDIQFVAQIIGRFIILIPALLLVRFSAIRHSSLFRLREHYSYKYSMAVSVEGFKKEANGYENAIAALVFEQLAFNPTDKLLPSNKIREADMKHPIMSYVIDNLRDIFKKDAK